MCNVNKVSHNSTVPLIFMCTFQHEEESETLAIWDYLYNKYKWHKQNMHAIRNILRCINFIVRPIHEQ